MRRRVVVLAVVAGGLASCAEPLIDDTFTPEQLAALEKQFVLPTAVQTCPPNFIGGGGGSCEALARLGAGLFADSLLSGDGKDSCVTCHDGSKYYIDDIPGMKNVSQKDGGGFTAHDALGLANIAYKTALEGSGSAFTWLGSGSNAQDVLLESTLPGAMHTNAATIAACIEANHLPDYEAVFGKLDGSADGSCGNEGPGSDSPRKAVECNVATALDGFLRSLVSVDSPFDRFIAGDDSALTAQEQHGFAVFAGNGICITCHSGPLLSDLQLHNTGVSQSGPNVPIVDPSNPDGLYVTPSLRNVAMTPPYMHAGQIGDLGSAVDFYRNGGGDSAVGEKDPRLATVDISDDDAADLVAFLNTLTGTPPCDVSTSKTSCE